MTNPAAWHPDPTGRHEHRYWDGERWTEHVADAGQASLDPLEGGSGGATTQQEQPASTTRPVSEPSAGGPGQSGDAGGDRGGDASTTGAGTTSAGWQQPESSAGQGPSPADASWQQPSGTSWSSSGDASWQQPQYGQPSPWATAGTTAARPGNDGLAIAALIVGILSLLTSWFLLGAFGGIIALVLGFIALSRIKRSGAGGRGMAITGIVTGILSLVVAGLVVAFFGFFIQSSGGFGFVDEYVQCIEEGNTEAFCDEQLEEGLIQRFGG